MNAHNRLHMDSGDFANKSASVRINQHAYAECNQDTRDFGGQSAATHSAANIACSSSSSITDVEKTGTKMDIPASCMSVLGGTVVSQWKHQHDPFDVPVQPRTLMVVRVDPQMRGHADASPGQYGPCRCKVSSGTLACMFVRL